jgi:hypothetical protein
MLPGLPEHDRKVQSSKFKVKTSGKISQTENSIVGAGSPRPSELTHQESFSSRKGWAGDPGINVY